MFFALKFSQVVGCNRVCHEIQGGKARRSERVELNQITLTEREREREREREKRKKGGKTN